MICQRCVSYYKQSVVNKKKKKQILKMLLQLKEYISGIKHKPAAMRRWCNGIMQDTHSCDPGSIPGRRT